MAQAVFDSPVHSVEGETKTLSTTAQYIAVKPGFHEVELHCLSQWRLALGPKLVHALFYPAEFNPDDVQKVTDRVATTYMSIGGMVTVDYVYLGFSEPALGVYFDMVAGSVNAEAATLDVEYCSTPVDLGQAIAFTDVAGDSDGTTSGGATLAVDGVYTWTLPSAWKRSTLGTANIPLYSKCYWIRFKPSGILSATISIAEIIPVYQNVNYAYMEPGVVYPKALNVAQIGGMVVLATSGTPVLDVNWIKH